ncbi:phosphomannomutase/phosphoglucomutase [Rickettsiales endosymbiont of Peranema trichophorum]|uniref:phosphomannomutase/phosphoglucomutase n=1 Tax=Rickettsiales endosymbiont of Peranema trichophorum TaxID=2486577 RepID=UPI001022BCD4|nr:phosphomannomutase/phosphoglucomutase [Rickettsiales endosymbiont of Peranema trichophorum]RZI47557.1 phosphomannomutase/phosphoglucomutase [Rickettsiales endosymbiont of Peranema trichophorum]
MSQEASHVFDAQILRKYDIRGIYGDNVNAADGYFLGRSFAVLLKEHGLPLSVLVGYDGRFSSPILEKELVEGLKDSGVNVLRVGLVPTPVLYFGTHTLSDYQSGIMITGSHNPPEYNGFKIVMNKCAIFDKDIKKLAEISKTGLFLRGDGVVETQDVLDSYVQKVAGLIKPQCGKKRLKVVWDCAGGATSMAIQALTLKLPGEHHIINEKIDGYLRNADPSHPPNLERLINVVRSESADLGIAFDGDGDRIGVVDQKGRIVASEELTLLFVKSILAKRSKPDRKELKFLFDIKTSDVICRKVEEWGANSILWHTGHSLIKQKMKEEHIVFASEMSGHVFFGDDYYGYDDGIFAGCKLLSILSRSKKSLAELCEMLPSIYSTPTIHLVCKESEKFEIIEELKSYLSNQNIDFNALDGIRRQSKKGWWLIRASNTQNCLVIRAEAYKEVDLAELCKELISILSTSNTQLDLLQLYELTNQ